MKRTLLALTLGMGSFLGHAQDFKLAPPMLKVSPSTFTDSAQVTVAFGRSESQVMIEIGDAEAVPYQGPIFLKESAVIKAYASEERFKASDKVQAQAVKVKTVAHELISATAPSEKYPNSGNELLDHVSAEVSYVDAGWLGYDADSVVYQFTTKEPLNAIGVTFLNSPRAWILHPSEIELTGTVNGENVFHETFTSLKETLGTLNAKEHKLWTEVGSLSKTHTQIEWTMILRPSTLPEGHPGAGAKGWIFVDELILN